ncbi:aminotransferase class I/II-fold pyridoxal phosphate-dependent enzyme [Halodesulfovibrio marinisediminis]|uniref:aminotransferase class I/II-fold pyridoxal phosphate-dependent enzyme n=1 Tax=Halodesulfovibrio marinisediminis TaxID=458711 RepID=UPI001FE6130A|nr:aminotransferase class I/II-fold pyridoxal phosphate-dependent enzyme [Halodesulfovibrio marinisediminis]
MYRDPVTVEKQVGSRALVEGKELINFASNDYLGLSQNSEWQQTLRECFTTHAPSGTSSRLVTGHSKFTEDVERQFAEYFGYEDAMFLPSGYQANLSIIWGLCSPAETLFYDKRIHASMAQALPQTGSTLRGFAHSDLKQLDRKLAATDSDSPVVLTESLFSMDGDMLDTHAFEILRRKYNFFGIIDEAHSFGALGANGTGIAHGCTDIAVGTFGKALGMFGAFILMPKGFKEFFHNFSSPVIYSTAMPEAHAAAAAALLRKLPDMEPEREHLAHVSTLLRTELQSAGFTIQGDAHIVSIEISDEMKAATIAEKMREDGVLAFASRYPTVPMNKAVIRVSMTALHSTEDVHTFVNSIRGWYDRT